MSEKPPAFVVVDKRKFTAEGDLREGAAAPEPEVLKIAPASVEAAQPASAKVVTMPAPASLSEQELAADDLGDEEMSGALNPLGDAAFPEAADDLLAYDEDPEQAPLEPRSSAETAAQDEAYRQSSRDIDSMLRQTNPGMQTPGVVGFEHVIQSFYLSAIMAMGAGTEPGQKPRIDILGARQAIDMLAVLEQKTKGNLSPEEQQLVQGITFELRMMFLELTNAISRQAQQGSAVPPGAGLR